MDSSLLQPVDKPKSGSRVIPLNVGVPSDLEYKDLKKDFKSIVSKLITIRNGFSQKLKKDALPSLTTQNDEIEEVSPDVFRYKTPETQPKSRIID